MIFSLFLQIKNPKFSLFFLSRTYANSHPLSVLSSLSLAPLSLSFPCGFSSLLVVTIRSEIEFWVCGGCDRVLIFVFVHMCLVVVVVVVDFGREGGFSWILAMSFMGLTMEVGCSSALFLCLFFVYNGLWLPQWWLSLAVEVAMASC